MDYEHTQHAGNGADVLKHFMLAALLSHYVEKPGPLWYLETHAGAGLYDFPANSGKAIFRVPPRKVPHANAPAFKAAWPKEDDNRSHYPGSPIIADTLLRPQDRMTLFETSGPDFGRLGEVVVRKELGIHMDDGFLGVPRALRAPDAEDDDCEAIIFIDPDYTDDGDWERVLGTVAEISLARPGSTIIVWYPIFEHNPGTRQFDRAEFKDALAELAIEHEDSFLWQEAITDFHSAGAGMCILNARLGTTAVLVKAILCGRSVYRTGLGNLHWGG